jgi:hypothetical protein
MSKEPKARIPIASAVLAVAIVWLGLRQGLPLQADTLFQSELPRPGREPTNPQFVRSDSGGRIFCGLEQSPVWLDVPRDFSTDGGAEFHCDPTKENLTDTDWPETAGTYDDRGYLIGFWPENTPIVSPFELIYEVDLTRLPDGCDNCLAGRYYDEQSRQWKTLPTVYEPGLARASVEIDRFLPASGYPAFENRFVIALFLQPAEPTPKPAVPATPTPSRAPSPSSEPVAEETITQPEPTVEPPTDTPALPPSPTAGMLTETPTQELAMATPTARPSPTAETETPTAKPSPTAEAETPPVPPAAPAERDGVSTGTYVLIGVGLLAMTIIAVALIRRGRGGFAPRRPQAGVARSQAIPAAGTAAPPLASPVRQPEGAATLSLLHGQAHPPTPALSQQTLRIGRSAQHNDVVIQDLPVSRHHAEIRWLNGKHIVHDLESTNGTFVNGQRIVQPHPLRNGDHIVMGNSEWLYYIGVTPGDQSSR